MGIPSKQFTPTEFYHITLRGTFGAASGTVKNTPGYLDSIVFNDIAVAGVLSLYDDKAATKNILSSLSLTTRAAGSQVPYTHFVGVNFGTALTFNFDGSYDALIVYN